MSMNLFKTASLSFVLAAFSGCLVDGQTFKCDSATGVDCITDGGTGNLPDGGGTTNRCGDGVANAGEFSFTTNFTRTFQYELEPDQVNTAGTRLNGELHWDFRNAKGRGSSTSKAVSYERAEGTQTTAIFPEASFVVAADNEYKEIYQETSSGLFLAGLGAFGSASGSYLVLNPSILIRKYPLKVGTTGGNGSQFTSYSPSNQMLGQGTLQVTWSVDAEGILETPQGAIRVHRISEEWKNGDANGLSSSRRFVFWSDCLGAVATITSYANEPKAEFTQALSLEYLK